MLFNKVTERLLLGGVKKKIESVMSKYTMENFKHLFEFQHGMLIRSELLKLMINIKYFSANTLITGRLKHNQMFTHNGKDNKPKPVKYMENITLTRDEAKNLVSLITQELSFVPVVLKKFKMIEKESNPEVRDSQINILRNYFYNSLFPIVYQYVKNIQTTYFINHKLVNKEEIDYHR
jgi:hypothetical protein